MTYDFHSVCVSCRGIDCDLEHRCDECANIDDDAMTVYVRRRRLLLQKQHSKSKRKDPLLCASAVANPVIVNNPPSSVELPPVSLDPPSVLEDFQSTVDAKLAVLKNEMSEQFRSFFDEFNKQLEVKFSSINRSLSQVRSTSSSDTVEQVVFSS